MKKLFTIVIVSTALAGCFHDKPGTRVGTTLQDCAVVPANQREDTAKMIKGLSREDAINAIATKFNVSSEAARQCLK